MKHIIVTTFGTKQELRFAIRQLNKYQMKPRYLRASATMNSKESVGKYVVIRPIDGKELAELTAERGKRSIENSIIDLPDEVSE